MTLHERATYHTSMEAKLPYGQNAILNLQLPEEKLLAWYGRSLGEPLDDIVAAMAAALLDPLGYPPLTQAVVSGDRVAIPIDPALPRPNRLVAGLVGVLCEAGVAPEDITLVVAANPEPRDDDPRAELSETIAKRVGLVIHDPDDRDALGFLATSAENQPIYLNRSIQDADVVLPIGCLRPESALAYHGIHTVLFPTFADTATRDRYHKASNEDSAVARRRRREESQEAAWLLGLNATIQIIPGASSSILQILAGDPAKVEEEGARRIAAAHHHQVDQQASLVIVGIDGNRSHQTWENVARAVNAGLSAVIDGGIVVVCSELEVPPGMALAQLAHEDDIPAASHTIRGTAAEDAMAAAQLLAAREQAHLFLLSRLDEEVVSSLGIAPVGTEEEIGRLCSRTESCALIGAAQFAEMRLANASS